MRAPKSALRVSLLLVAPLALALSATPAWGKAGSQPEVKRVRLAQTEVVSPGTVTARLRVINRSETTTRPRGVRLLISPWKSGARTLVGRKRIPRLAPGRRRTLTVEMAIPAQAAPGPHDVFACASRCRRAASGLLIGAPSPPDPKYLSEEQIQAAIEQNYQAFAQLNDVPGMAIAVVAPGPNGVLRPVYGLYGFAELASQTPVRTTTQFEIGSESKVFTTALLARAVELNQIELSDGVQAQLPPGITAPSNCGESFTYAELAEHRSGLERLPANYGPTPADHANYTQAQLFDALDTTTLLSCPGSSWVYSNFGFGLLGTLLADLGGSTYGDLVEDVVTGPLGMSSTYLEEPGPRLATGYCANGSVAPRWDNTGALAGGGGLISTIADMSEFVKASLGEGPAATVATLAATQAQISPAGGGGPAMGLGWQLYDRPGIPGTYAFKDGGTNGFHSATFLVPAANLGVTLMTNGPSDPDHLGRGILETLLGAPGEIVPPEGDPESGC